MIFPVFYYLIVTAVSALLVLIILPSVIYIAHQNKLFDDLTAPRKQHNYGIPRLGGIAFYISIILTSLFIAQKGTESSSYDLYAAGIILFAMGIKDDLTGVNHHNKLAVQALVSFIITVSGDIRITNLYGLFDIYELNYVTSILISVLLIIFVINSFNLIDGIDGLAGTLGVIVCCTFGCYFTLQGQTRLAALSFSVSGSLIAFLIYNYSPAKIFMGDSGSLFLGMLSAFFAIKFININEASTIYNIHAALAFAMAVLIIPAFDTCSVVVTRIYNKKSPFKPDRNHIHHRMLLLGLTHLQTTFILAGINILFIGLALLFNQADNQLLILLFVGVLLVLNNLVNYLLRVKAKQATQLVA